MNTINPKQYAEALYLAFTEAGSQAENQIISNLETLLRTNGDFDQYAKIIEEFEKIASATPSEEIRVMEARQVITDSEVMEVMNMKAKETIITKGMDEDLIGGVVIRSDSEQLDLSVRNKLNSLHSNLIQ